MLENGCKKLMETMFTISVMTQLYAVVYKSADRIQISGEFSLEFHHVHNRIQKYSVENMFLKSHL